MRTLSPRRRVSPRSFPRPFVAACIVGAPLLSAPAEAEDKPVKAVPATKEAPAAKDATAQPAIAAELQKLGFLVGRFTCEAERPESGRTPAQKWKAHFTGRWSLDGRFVAFEYASDKPARPKGKGSDKDAAASAEVPSHGREGHFGWDRGLGRYTYGGADNIGSSFLLKAEPPVDDAAPFTWKGNATASLGRHVPVEWKLTRTDKGFDVSAESSDLDGQMIVEARERCARGK